jgi:hypothetical protein
MRAFVDQRIRFLVRIPGKKIVQVIKAINNPMGEPAEDEAVS